MISLLRIPERKKQNKKSKYFRTCALIGNTFKIKNNKSFNMCNNLKCVHINRDIEKLKLLGVHFF